MAHILGDLCISLGAISCVCFVLAIGCVIADYVMPNIPFVERFLETLPIWKEED